MLPIITILILGIILVAGIGIVAFFAYKTVKIQQEMIQNIAMFKKASDPFHIGMMSAAMNALKEEEPKVEEDPMNDSAIPQNPTDEAMATLRQNI